MDHEMLMPMTEHHGDAAQRLLRLASLLIGWNRPTDLLTGALSYLASAYSGTTWLALQETEPNLFVATSHTAIAAENIEQLAELACATPVRVDERQGAVLPYQLDPVWAAWPTTLNPKMILGVWVDPGAQVPDEEDVQMALFLLASAFERHRELVLLREQSTTDALTGVLNRRAILDCLERGLALAHRHDDPLSVLYLDVDDFKQINDNHGHAVGDRALRAVADSILDAARSTDIVGRLGGDEFLVVMPNTDLAGAERAAMRLGEKIRATTIDADGVSILLRATAGCACSDEPISDIIEAADHRMLQNKCAGRIRPFAAVEAYAASA